MIERNYRSTKNRFYKEISLSSVKLNVEFPLEASCPTFWNAMHLAANKSIYVYVNEFIFMLVYVRAHMRLFVCCAYERSCE